MKHPQTHTHIHTQKQTYEQTLLDLWDYAQAQGLPYRSLQIDSWWYYKV